MSNNEKKEAEATVSVAAASAASTGSDNIDPPEELFHQNIKVNTNFRKFLSNIETLHLENEELEDSDESDDDDDDEEEDDDEDEDDEENDNYDDDESNDEYDQEIEYDDDEETKSSKNHNQQETDQTIIDEFNDVTTKYLNILGEDLLMEEQDILVENSVNTNTTNINNNNKLSNLNQSPESDHQLSVNHHKDTDNNNDDDDETATYFDDRFKIAQVDLIAVVEQLNKTIESERNEKNRLKIRLNNVIQENKNKSSLITQFEIERNELISELNNLRSLKIKETKRLNAELDAVSREYSQVMSERDMVHKEMEALQEQLSKAQDRLKKYARESVVLASTNTQQHYHNESVHNYNDLNLTNLCNMSINETNVNANLNVGPLNEMNTSTSRQQKVNSLIYGYSSVMDESLEIDSLRQQINMLTRQRDDAVNQIKELFYQMGKNPDEINDYSGSEYVDRFIAAKILNENINNNPNNPEYENEKLKFELKELSKEIENAKKRRDLAFNERDKMIKERESIRALCDDMRHQRDKAISDLAEAISECDELRKQKAMAYRQIQILEKNLGIMEEKLAYIREMNEMKEQEEEEEKQNRETSSLQKSADSDELNWKTIRVDIELGGASELGIELAYASKIIEKLEVNEQLLDQSISELNDFNVNMSPMIEHKKSRTLSAYEEHSLEKKTSDLESPSLKYDAISKFLKQDFEEQNDVTDNNKKSQSDNLGPDELILISDVDENGLAYGKLKVFDRLIKINDVDVKNLSADEIKQIIVSSKEMISFIISRHFGKSNDCFVRNHSASSPKHLERDPSKKDENEDDDEIEDEIISTSMSLITTSSSNSNLKPVQTVGQKQQPKITKSNSYGNSNDDSTFKFESSDINRYNQKFLPTHQPINSKTVIERQRNSSSETTESLNLVTMNKSSLTDLLLETGVYVANIVHKKKAELSVGDQILSINGHSLTNKTLYEIMDLINQAHQFKLVVKHRIFHNNQSKPSKEIQLNRFSSVSRNRGFIVLSRSNLSGSSSASFLNQTIRNNAEPSLLKPSLNLKSSSNLIFNIKDQKEIRKQIEASNQAAIAVGRQANKPIGEIELVKHHKECKKFFAQKIANIEQKEQDLLDENLCKYQELIKNFHSQSRKGNQLYVDIDVVEAEHNQQQNRLSKHLREIIHKTSPKVQAKDLHSNTTSNVSGIDSSVATAVTAKAEPVAKKRIRKSNTHTNSQQTKFNHRRSTQVTDNI